LRRTTRDRRDPQQGHAEKKAFIFLRKEIKLKINWDMGRKCSEKK
jgi:hypothetical protein